MFCILKVIHYYWLIFANLREKCFKIYCLESAKFLSAPGFVWQASLRKAEVKLELLTDTDMLLMVEKDIRGEICHAIHRYEKANNKHRKDSDKNKELSCLKYWGLNNLCGWAMPNKFPVDNFE